MSSSESGIHLFERLVALCSLVFVALAAGSTYLYGFYLPQLISQCGLNASDSALIALACNAGLSLGGFPAGILIDRRGPRECIILGSVCILTGYYLIYRICESQASNLLGLCFSNILTGFGCIILYFATLKAAQSNFPNHRGAAGAFPVSAYGLSATVFSALGASFFVNNTGGFLLFLCLFSGLVVFFGSFLVNIHLAHEDDLKDADPETAIQQTTMKRSSSLRGSFSFWGVGHRQSISSVNSESSPLLNESAISSDLSRSRTGSSVSLFRPAVPQAPRSSSSDLTPFQIVKARLCDYTFLTHYLIVALIGGSGQMYIYSVGFVAKAQMNYGRQGMDPISAASVQAVQVSIISVASFSGRFLAGFLSDHIYKVHKLLRLWIIIAVGILLIVGQYVVIVNKNSIPLMNMSSAIIGLCYGMTFGTYPAIIADRYGTRTFSSTWGLICTGPLFLLFALNKCFGYIYDKHSDKHGTCFDGNGCYKGAFEVGLMACLVMLVTVTTLMFLQRKDPK